MEKYFTEQLNNTTSLVDVNKLATKSAYFSDLQDGDKVLYFFKKTDATLILERVSERDLYKFNNNEFIYDKNVQFKSTFPVFICKE